MTLFMFQFVRTTHECFDRMTPVGNRGAGGAMKMLIAVALGALLLALAPVRARAAEPDAPAEKTESEWYGMASLVPDLTAAVGIVTMDTDREIGFAPAQLGYCAGLVFAPINHLLHDNPGRAIGSLVLRLGAGLLFAESALFVGMQRASVTTGSALLLVMAIDDAALAWHQRPVPPKPVNLTAGLRVNRGMGLVSLLGTF